MNGHTISGQGLVGRLALGAAVLVLLGGTATGLGLWPREAAAGTGQRTLVGQPADDRAKAEEQTISVSGVGEVQRKPDYALVTVGVFVREKTAGAASARAGEVMKAINKAVGELNVPGAQLQTSGVNLSPSYDYNQRDADGQPVQRGFDASMQVTVRTTDVSKVGELIDSAVKAGANRIDGVRFEVNQAVEARQESLKLASKAAREKAEAIAEALGLRIVSVVNATSTDVGRGGWMMSQMSNLATDGGARGMGEAVEPGLVTVQSQVQVTFRVVGR